MRRALSILAVCMVAALAGSALASAQVPPQQDTVTGSGVVGITPLQQWNPFFNNALFGFNIEAASDSSGTTPSGRAGLTGCLLIFCPSDFASLIPDLATGGGPVTCLAVSGERAVVGVEQPFQLPFGAFQGILFYVIDGGPLEPGGTSPDTIAFTLTTAVPHECTDPDSPDFIVGVHPMTFGVPAGVGDLVVHDALPFPTSKDQCKNGGWHNFPDFKNEGDCVSFVATREKNQPGGSTG